MIFLRAGHYFGQRNRTIQLSGITINDTEYSQEKLIDWRYHENAYFTFVLEGKIIESTKKKSYHCSAGSLLFHSWQEPHYNIKSEDSMRCLKIEFDKHCFDSWDFSIDTLQGIFSVESPNLKFLLYKLFRETRIFDDVTAPSILMLISFYFCF